MKDRDKIEKLLSLCLDLNPEGTLEDAESKKPTVFFSFSGHVGLVDIYVHSNGWKENGFPDYWYRNTSWGKWILCFKSGEDKQVSVDDVITHLEQLKEENV